jgi:pimeloyl-ACP methyl ester carboxylesterase
MYTLYANSTDGTQIAYDLFGEGPAIVLLHGGGGSRQEWHEAGYIRLLQEDYTVITMDLRGHGESGLPVRPEDYAIELMC